MDDVSYSRIPPEATERWTTVRDAVAGDQAVRAGSYLPTLNSFDQTQANIDRNAAYKQRAVWYPATGFTLEGLIGLAFRVDPQTNLPDYLKYLTTNADGAGISLYQQAQDSLAHNVSVGRHGLYVDFAEGMGKPVIKPYTAENIINWGYDFTGGKVELNLVVLYESVEVRDGFALKYIPQWREIALEDGKAICRVWRHSDPTNTKSAKVQQKFRDPNRNNIEVDQIELRSKGKVLNYIPFAFIGSQNNDASIDQSPLYGLAQVNMAHFRNSADYEDSVFFVGQAQPWLSGLDQEWRNFLQNPYYTDETGKQVYTGQKMYVGSRAPMMLPVNGAFGFAQAEPNSLVGDAMKTKEDQMIKIGARLIEATQAGKTATGENNDREATTSVLSMCVANVNEAYQKCIVWCAAYLDKVLDAADAFKINQDFVQAAADPQIMSELVKSWQTGIMAKNDVRAYYRKLGLIPTERKDEDIDSDITAEGPALGTMGDPANPGDPASTPGQPGAPGGGTPPGDQEPPDLPPGDTPEEQAVRTQRGFPPRRAQPSASPAPAPARLPATRQPTDVIDVEPRPVPTLESTPPFDMNVLVQAITDVLRQMQPPNVTINMPEQPPPQVTVNQAPVTVEAPVVNITPPAVNVEGATVNVTPPAVNVEAPVVNVTPPAVNVEAPQVNVTIDKGSGGKTANLTKTPTGYQMTVSPDTPTQ